MIGKLSAILVYDVPGGRPLAVARTDDSETVSAVAQIALNEASAKASALTEADPMIGAVEREEVARLKRVLGLFAPEVLVTEGPEQGVERPVM